VLAHLLHPREDLCKDSLSLWHGPTKNLCLILRGSHSGFSHNSRPSLFVLSLITPFMFLTFENVEHLPRSFNLPIGFFLSFSSNPFVFQDCELNLVDRLFLSLRSSPLLAIFNRRMITEPLPPPFSLCSDYQVSSPRLSRFPPRALSLCLLLLSLPIPDRMSEIPSTPVFVLFIRA